jgi:hypothetical protein
MSVTVRPYVTGGWEVDIRVVLPDGTVIRERKKAQQTSESSARRWAEARERHLLLHGKPKPVREEVQKTPTLREFAPRFLEGYAKANRLKPSGVSSKEVAIRVHLFPLLGDRRLHAIRTEDVQQLKSAMVAKSPKTVNNVLTVLSVMLRTAAEWNVIDRVPCTIKLLKAPKTTRRFTTSRRTSGWSKRPGRMLWRTQSSCSVAKRASGAARSWRSSGPTST